jgi:carbonic anhydrase
LAIAPGEAAVIRNVGGRITPATLQTMAMLRTVAKASGGEIGLG